MPAACDASKTLAPEPAPGDTTCSPLAVLAGARGRLTLAATCSITLSTTARLASGRTVVPEAALPISLFLVPEELDALQRLARALRSGYAALVRAALGRQRTVEPQAAERVLNSAWATHGSAALVAHGTNDLRYLPPDAPMVSGRAAVEATLTTRQDTLTFTPIGAEIAASGDLGYSYGAALRKAGPSAAPEAGGYMRVWRRSERGVWQVALELHTMPRP